MGDLKLPSGHLLTNDLTNENRARGRLRIMAFRPDFALWSVVSFADCYGRSMAGEVLISPSVLVSRYPMETNLSEDEPGLDLSVLCSCDHRYADPPTLDVFQKTLPTLSDKKREGVAANLRFSTRDWRQKRSNMLSYSKAGNDVSCEHIEVHSVGEFSLMCGWRHGIDPHEAAVVPKLRALLELVSLQASAVPFRRHPHGHC